MDVPSSRCPACHERIANPRIQVISIIVAVLAVLAVYKGFIFFIHWHGNRQINRTELPDSMFESVPRETVPKPVNPQAPAADESTESPTQGSFPSAPSGTAETLPENAKLDAK